MKVFLPLGKINSIFFAIFQVAKVSSVRVYIISVWNGTGREYETDIRDLFNLSCVGDEVPV